MKKMKKQFVVAMVVLMLLSISSAVNLIPVSAVTEDPDLDDEHLSPNENFRIFYTKTNCSPVRHLNKCITDANATTLGIDLEEIYDIYTDPRGDFQFNDPTRGTTMPVLIHPINGGYFGMAWTDVWIELAPLIFSDAHMSRTTPLHEMLHEVQYAYGWPGGLYESAFVMEGTARMMQDKLYDDLDQSNGTEFNAYFLAADLFLRAFTDKTLIDQSYFTCLFWTYFTEQYGNVITEPQVGVDAVRTVFEHHGDGSDDIQRVNAALNILSPGTTFQDVFMDFIVANYAKNLTGPSVPAKYQYLDDDRSPGLYRGPALTLDLDMTLGDAVSATDEIRAWSAKYYEANLSADVPFISVDFHQPTALAVTLVYNLLVIKDDDLVRDVCNFNVMGRNFEKSIFNDDYDRVVVVVGALDHPAAFQYTVSTGGGMPTLNILWPQTRDPAQVDVHDQNTFHVHLEVVGPGGVVLSDLEPDDFQVTVDATNFSVVTGHEVMGQYWLLVQPKPLGVGTYDLQVSLAAGNLLDTEVTAVTFSNMVNVDNVIVIDRSGSMLEPNWTARYWEEPDPTDKIYGAIDAATLYVNSFRTGDKIGLIWFSTEANTARTLRYFNDDNREDFITRIDTFDEDESGAWRATSIGDGLWNAQDELDNRGAADHDWVIILLSDGKENRDRWIADVVCDTCKIDYCDRGICDPNRVKTTIHAVALGSNADREKLEDIAFKTGGTFEYAIEPASGDLPNDLADIYRTFAETVLLEQRIAAIRGEYHMSPPHPNHTINMEAGATEATFVVNYNWRGIPNYGGIPIVTLHDPSGKLVNPTYVDDTHHLFRVSLPQSGPWTVKLEQPAAGPEFCCEGHYLIEVSVKSKATLEVFLGIPPEERVIGVHLPIIAFLTDTQPITGATIDVEITTPELVTAVAILPSEINTLRLYDDGHHGDGKVNDGVYGGTFRNTNREGIYSMKVKAEGYSSLVGSFKRETKLAFNMRGDVDSDDDGLPDKWEKDHGLDPHNDEGDQGAEGDPDGDGLTNEEEFDTGTAPLDPDTDDGGENDGSETHAGRDPNDPEDDKVRPPTSLRAIPGVNSVNLTIGYLSEHDYLIVYRATSSEGPWESFGFYPTESYTDGGLENDVTYYYKVVGVVQRERPYKSAPTRVVSATPKADPIPPSGYVVINDGDERTDTEDVTLMIWAALDTIEMNISNDPELIDATWEAFDTRKSWTLLPGKGLRTIYVLFKDAAGNIGPRSPYDPSVEIQPAMDSIISAGGVPGVVQPTWVSEEEYLELITQPVDISKIRYVLSTLDEEWTKGSEYLGRAVEIMYWQKDTKYLIDIDLNETGYVLDVEFRRWGKDVTEISYSLAKRSLDKLGCPPLEP